MLLQKKHQEDLRSLTIFPEIKYSTLGLIAGSLDFSAVSTLV